MFFSIEDDLETPYGLIFKSQAESWVIESLKIFKFLLINDQTRKPSYSIVH